MTNFNLEHAKRGCVVSIFNIYDMTNRVYLCRLIEDNEYYDLQSSWTIEVGDEYLIKGMATLEEWEAAGFKRENYIERPPSAVKALQDDNGHWYVIPTELCDEFESDHDDMDMLDNGSFDEKWSKYQTNGSVNNVQLYSMKGGA